MELRTAILQSSSSLPPRFHTLKPTPDFAFPFSLFVSNPLRLSCFTFVSKDQQHSFPVTARDTRAVLNCISEGLSCTGASSGDCSCDDKRDDDEDAMGFLNNYEMIIRDCDKLIEAFMVDERNWRRLLVFNKKWNNIRPHFFRHCQDKADTEDNPVTKNKLLWLGKKLKEIDQELQGHNELIEMIKGNPSKICEIVSSSRKDFTKEFFMHLHTIAESYGYNLERQNDLLKLWNTCLAAVKVYDAATESIEALNAAELNFQDIIKSPPDAFCWKIDNLAEKSQCFNPELVAHWLREGAAASYFNMEGNLINILYLLIFLISLKLLFFRKRLKNPAPSPPSLPIIGNLHQLKKQPLHRALYDLSQKYGPNNILSLRFGSQPVLVVSSASAAEECFTKNDIIFANRFRSSLTKYIGFNHTIITASSYGDHWRNLRRISSLEILSNHRLNSFLGVRKDETMKLLRKLAKGSDKDFRRVELRPMFSELTFNIIIKMVCGKRYYGEEYDGTNAEEAKRFREIMNEISQFGLGSNLADFVPLFRLFSSRKKLRKVGEKLDAFFQGLIDEHRNKKESSNTMIGHLLSSQESQPEYYTDQTIKGLIMALYVAGTETSAVALEWAMSNLLNSPEVLEKARVELDTQVGQDRLIEEADVTKLQYLQNIISETLRLHPPLSMLLPHLSSEDCTVGSYDVPRNTMLMVNAWAIHRDPKIWADPTSFKPERFENGPVDAHKLISFGLGRRACPGAGMAQRTLGLTLGSLIQCFEWKRIGEEKVDMTEGGGTIVPKAIPLDAQCKARPIISKIF